MKVGSILMEEKMVTLFDDERLDYLMAAEEMKIIQSPTIFSYSLDAVLLAHFAYMPVNRGNMLDLCTGNGVIPLLLSTRTKGHIIGLDIQERLTNMANRNVAINHLEDRIDIIHGDLKVRQAGLRQSFYDVVTCNPPYFPTPKETEHNENEFLTIARHEVHCTLEDVIKACKLYVRPGGKVALVHRPERLVDIITFMRNYRLEPKRMQLVYPKQGKEANTLLMEAVRDGKPGLKIADPLYIYDKSGRYTDDARRIIYGK
jgi:tRNA1(Val) A37 N6-methylase TrmN6